MRDEPRTTAGPYAFAIGEPLPGTKYVLCAQLGQGGMGAVFEVVKEPRLRGVAKIMLPHLAKRPEMVARFFREAGILAELSHPNIVRIKDYDRLQDGTPFYVMECVEGMSLRRFLNDATPPPPKMIFLVMQGLLEGLYCIHGKGIVHRDVKPENIILHASDPFAVNGAVKLIDFGIADDASSTHAPGDVVGTTPYLAPELLRGERATPQSDIYAAGVVAYEMIAHRRPFDHVRGRGEKALRQEITEGSPPPLRYFAPWVPEDVETVIMSALAKDPKERPDTAYRFLVDIYKVESAQIPDRVIADMNTTEPEFTTAIETLARTIATKRAPVDNSTVEFDLRPPVEGPAPEAAPLELRIELEREIGASRAAQVPPTLSLPVPDRRRAIHTTAPVENLDALPRPVPPMATPTTSGDTPSYSRSVVDTSTRSSRWSARTMAAIAATVAIACGVFGLFAMRGGKRSSLAAETAHELPADTSSVPIVAASSPTPRPTAMTPVAATVDRAAPEPLPTPVLAALPQASVRPIAPVARERAVPKSSASSDTPRPVAPPKRSKAASPADEDFADLLSVPAASAKPHVGGGL